MWEETQIDPAIFQILRNTWTGKPERKAEEAFLDAGFSVVVCDAEIWQSDNYHPEEIYTVNQVTLFLDENRNVDHICDG